MPTLARRLLSRVNDQPIRNKLLMTYFLFISIPLVSFSVLSAVTATRHYEDQIRFSARQSFEQARMFIGSRLDSLIKVSDIVYFSSEVQTVLSRERRTYERNIVQQYQDYLELDRFLTNFKDTYDIYRVTLYVPAWLMYADQKLNFDNIDEFKKQAIYSRVAEEREKVTWLPPEEIIDGNDMRNTVRVISLARRVRNTEKLDDIIGIVKISIQERTIREILEKANITRSGVVFIKNAEGQTICSTGGLEGVVATLGAGIEKTKSAAPLDWTSLSIGGADFTVNAQSIDNTDWTLVTAIPDSEIHYRSAGMKRTMTIVLVVIAAIAYASAALISLSATKRIRELTAAMDVVREKRLDVALESEANDEIGKMVRSFNYMVRRMRCLVKERYRAGQEVKSAELRALQAQINPHFLYNTLDLINWKAIQSGTNEIAEISRTLARFYNLSLNDGRDTVTIGDELEHAKAYTRIQNSRFGDRIRLIIDVSETIRSFGIPKIILQPLVENSILHGILEKGDDAAGTVRISGRMEGKTVVIAVEDDGIGISDVALQGIFEGPRELGKRHGYGLHNINDRIKLRFGRRFGLSFKRGETGGTIAEMRIPAVAAEIGKA